MKILFVIKELEYHPPLGIMQISAMTSKNNHESYLAVASREEIFDKIRKIKPDIVAYGGSTGEHKHYSGLNREIKESYPGIFTVMGGPHVTFFPRFIEEANLDAVCIGEGEYAFQELVEKLSKKQSVKNIQNFAFPKGKINSLRPLVQNLDELPFPDRELFYKNEDGELTENGKSKLKNFMIGRGCPYKCSYCFNEAFRKKYPGERYIRRHSVEYVLEEIVKTKEKYPLSYVKFYDDIFTFEVDEWLEEFSEKYKERIGLPFYCLTRADLMTKDMAKLLKKAGCQTIQMAVESVNDNIRKELLHRNMTKEQMCKAFKICRDEGITIVTNYILGLPTSSIQDDIEAIYFNIENKIHVTEFPIFQPYPETELGELCLKKGWFDKNFESIHMSYNNRSPLSCFTEEEKDIQTNINRLGQLASTFGTGILGQKLPSITELIMKKLIYEKPNEFFAKIYAQHKWEVYSKLVYPIKQSEEEEEKAYTKTLKLETFKRTDEKIKK